ncbi:MAG: response regulator [Ignavibacteriales bacterium]|jgi:CheY-like chemotaxis protein|nr:response regulator [Ignavibacteriales bacterium]MBP9120217.1 response regulator [Ignavibacterium sp.]RPI60554.1 MAG: response regulator [Ignavibacteriales bacterium]
MAKLERKGLIIDDEAIIALHISLIAKRTGLATTFLANNSKTAFEIFSREKLDILFVDINIAGELDGVELAKQLCAIKTTPVIFISGNADKQVRTRLFDEKLSFPHNYLIKPVDDAVLKKLIQSMLA